MEKIIRLPATAARKKDEEPWERSPPLAVGGYWKLCYGCTNKCYRAGHNFIACAEHSQYGTLWKERQQIYERLCETLTSYEHRNHDLLDYVEAAEYLHDMLAEIQSKWSTVITAETEAPNDLASKRGIHP